MDGDPIKYSCLCLQDDDEDDDGIRGNSVHLSSDESDLEDFAVPSMRA